MKRIYWTFLMMGIIFTSCNKFLEKKPNQKLVVPTTLRDLQALIEDPATINYSLSISGEVSAGDYYLPDNALNEMDEAVRNMYLWQKDNLFAVTNEEWALLYKVIYRCNIVLEQIDNIKPQVGEYEQWNAIKGNALFLRACCYTQIAWLWSVAYDKETAGNDLGVALRLTANFNEISQRTDVETSYRQIIEDLEASLKYLPVVSSHPITPSRPAAFGQLSRLYLSMRNYGMALAYADSCLQLRSELLDYNDDPNITPSSSYPFTRFNPEIIYMIGARRPAAFGKGIADTTLYDSYDANDLRKTIFFSGRKNVLNSFKGNYEGKNITGVLFYGPATDEMYLTMAECLIRKGDTEQGLNKLNTLLKKRYKSGTFTEYKLLSQSDALNLVLEERRKELIFRGLRWMDIKRLNKEGMNIKIARKVGDQLFTLEPNSLRYALPIPEYVVQLSGMQQNPR